MWKVKRMNTACIVVLTIALGAGGIAAYPAGGFDQLAAPAAPNAQLQTSQRQIWPAMTANDNFISPRGEGESAVAYGAASRQAMQT